jgi:uncharacterized protein YprB with RNaseH-like and TPR domain
MTDDRLKDRLESVGRLIGARAEKKSVSHLPDRYFRMAEAVGGRLVETAAGAFCFVRTLYPYGAAFGRLTLEGPGPQTTYPRSAFVLADADRSVEPSRLVFFDIETTGLGGAGTVPFLVACGSLTGEGYEVRQYLLPDYSDEAAMLEAVMTEFPDDRVVVSYNGTAFDLAIMRDRLIINRVATDFEPADHLDLLLPTRRLFKRRLGACNLVNVERELFGFHRIDDIPGYLIPSVYFSWLADENLEYMPAVIEHNKLDIFALHFLTTTIAEAFESGGESLQEVDDIYSLSRLFEKRKERPMVLKTCRRLGEEFSSESEEDILLFRSMVLKRSGNWSEAARIWESLSVSQSRFGFLACVELAKYLEHRRKDYARALDLARRAKAICPPAMTYRRDIEKRLRRLQARLGR